MTNRDRLTRLFYSKSENVLIASDVRGRLHKFDLELNLIDSSPTTSYNRPINALCLNDRFVFTKDRAGVIGKWDLATLFPLDFYDEHRIFNEQELGENDALSSSPQRAITVYNGRVYANNGYKQLVILDEETFDVIEIRRSFSPTYLDCLCMENAELHAISDCSGFVYIGNLETGEFPVRIRVDEAEPHTVHYDKLHDRYWASQDRGIGADAFSRTGVTTFEKDGSNFQEYKLSYDDTEFMEFSPDYRHLYVGGFSGKVFVFDNSEKQMRVKSVWGPFPFQIIHGAVVSDEAIFVLLQTGEIIRLNSKGDITHRTRFDNRCVWAIEPHPLDDSIVYAGTDGGVQILRYGLGKHQTVAVERLAKHSNGFGGITRSLKVLPDGSYVAVARGGVAYRADKHGMLLWYVEMAGLLRSVSVNSDYTKCMISTDKGTVLEVAIADGSELDRIELGRVANCTAYAPDGRRLIGTMTTNSITVFAPDSQKVVGEIKFNLHLKRFMTGSNGDLFVVGGDGVNELDLENYTVRKQFNECVSLTKEGAVLLNDHIHVGGYGAQVGTYRYEDCKIIDLKEFLPDFTKGFAGRIGEDGIPILLVGGRGGYLFAYRVIDGIPRKVRELYL